MKITYDPEADALHIRFKEVPVEESEEDRPGLIFDCDAEGNVVGVEILNARRHVDNPFSLNYEMLGPGSEETTQDRQETYTLAA